MDSILKRIEKLEALLKAQEVYHEEFLTLKEAAKYLQLSESCLYKIKGKNGLEYYKPRGKNIYFKKSDLDNWILAGKVESESALEEATLNYLSRTNKKSIGL